MARAVARDAVLTRALIVSAILHLSTVTLFRIVIYFPRQDIAYYDVAIVETRMPARTLREPAADPPQTAEDPGFEQLGVSGPGFHTVESDLALPDIQLPTLAFDELNLIRVRQEALETRSRYNEVFSGREADSWAGLGRRLDSVGETLSKLTFGGGGGREDAPRPITRPAPGFEAFVEWMSPPIDRQVLHVVPVDALWGVDPAELGEPITLVFDVDPDGNVVHVIDPLGMDTRYAHDAAAALERYRFAPLLDAEATTQRGTLILRPTRSPR